MPEIVPEHQSHEEQRVRSTGERIATESGVQGSRAVRAWCADVLRPAAVEVQATVPILPKVSSRSRKPQLTIAGRESFENSPTGRHLGHAHIDDARGERGGPGTVAISMAGR
jgi:hypothetical protein